ncbi:hypothetical protein PG988_007584 [Apiospora saccharicola]
MYGTFDTRQTIYHSSLSSKELRLLRFVMSSHDSLHFEVSTFPRNATPPYTAVSYTWGDGDASEVVLISGCKFPFLLGRSVRVHCGNTSMEWVDFRDLVYREEDFGHDTLLPDGNPPAVPPNASAAVPLLMGRSINRLPEYPQALHILLVQHRHSMCKDPRDRIFALLGLVSEDERLFLGRVFPDYTLSEQHVMIITLAHLTQYMPLAADLGTVKPDSEELFRGLGVTSKAQRRQLLRRAAALDYIGCESRDDFVRVLVFHDELDEYRPSEQDVEPERDWLPSDETTRHSKRRWLLVLSVGGVCAGLAAYFSYRHGGIRLWRAGCAFILS